MRISDWSSDVCSSDLSFHRRVLHVPRLLSPPQLVGWNVEVVQLDGSVQLSGAPSRRTSPSSRPQVSHSMIPLVPRPIQFLAEPPRTAPEPARTSDWQRVGWGKRVAGRVTDGGD